jgi:hypothetical protein
MHARLSHGLLNPGAFGFGDAYVLFHKPLEFLQCVVEAAAKVGRELILARTQVRTSTVPPRPDSSRRTACRSSKQRAARRLARAGTPGRHVYKTSSPASTSETASPPTH